MQPTTTRLPIRSLSALAGLLMALPLTAFAIPTGTRGDPAVPQRTARTEREVSGPVRVSGPIADGADAVHAARAALVRFAPDWGVDPSTLVHRATHRVGGLWALEHEQEFGGLVVAGSRVDALLDDRGDLVSLRARGLSRPPADATFRIDAERAAAVARESVPVEPEVQLAIGPIRAVLAAASADDDRLVPAFEVAVEAPSLHDGSWLVTVDARAGSALSVQRRSTCAVTGTVRGRATLAGPSTTSAPTLVGLGSLTLLGSDSGALLARLTSNACSDAEAVISSDGTRVAFVSDCDGDPEIWTVQSDGTGLLQLTFNTAADRAPAISSDGSRIAFVSLVDGDPEIFVVNSDGSGLLQITHNSVDDEDPSISGDGALVVWASAVGGDLEVCRSSTAVPAPAALTANSAFDGAPVLSLDGTRIAWVSDIDGDREIFVMDSDGTGVLQLTVNTVEDGAPSIRSDGGVIAFESLLPKSTVQGSGDPSATLSPARARAVLALVPPPPDYDVFLVTADGSSLRRLTSGHANERAPALTPLGNLVVFTTDEGGSTDLRAVDTGPGMLFAITSDALADSAPSASFDGARGTFGVLDGDLEVGAWNLSAPGAVLGGTTAAGGAYSLPAPDGTSPSVQARLRGSWVRVSDEFPSSGELAENVSAATAPSAGNDITFNAVGSDELATAQVNAYYHMTRAHDTLAGILRRPPLSAMGLLPIDVPLEARVNLPVTLANAFYNSARKEASFFIGRGIGRPNTAYDTLLLHEYGHYFDDVHGGLVGGNACEAAFAATEGFADALTLLVTGVPVVGANWTGPGTWLRNYGVPVPSGGSAGRQYDGLDCLVQAGRPEPHDHGEAFAGFVWKLRASAGAAAAEGLVVGALATNPPDMQGAVTAVFALAATPGFGGSGGPATSPLYDSICAAAAAHGFDCFPRPDQQSYGCLTSVCGGTPPSHKVCTTEWLGPLVDFEPGCEPLPNPDDDGLVVPSVLGSGTTAPMTFTLKVNPALRFTGRYGGSVGGAPLKERLVYLNVWALIDDAAGGFTVVKLLGTGSGSGITGPAGFGPDTLAYNPDTWAGPSLTVTYMVPIPSVPTDRFTILRSRIDYGEDCGHVGTCLSSPTLSGPCGVARFGEVEEKQIIITGP